MRAHRFTRMQFGKKIWPLANRVRILGILLRAMLERILVFASVRDGEIARLACGFTTPASSLRSQIRNLIAPGQACERIPPSRDH